MIGSYTIIPVLSFRCSSVSVVFWCLSFSEDHCLYIGSFITVIWDTRVETSSYWWEGLFIIVQYFPYLLWCQLKWEKTFACIISKYMNSVLKKFQSLRNQKKWNDLPTWIFYLIIIHIYSICAHVCVNAIWQTAFRTL